VESPYTTRFISSIKPKPKRFSIPGSSNYSSSSAIKNRNRISKSSKPYGMPTLISSSSLVYPVYAILIIRPIRKSRTNLISYSGSPFY
jgi:hypothetical protein